MPEDKEWRFKIEVLRVLDPRWTRHRAFVLRESGCSWAEIADALGLHEKTVQCYCRDGEKEHQHFGTLHYFLSVRARKWLLDRGIDSTSEHADHYAGLFVRRSYGVRRSGLGRATRDEILNAIDLLRETAFTTYV